jgi:hypothetical protein
MPMKINKGLILILPTGEVSPSIRNCRGNPPAMTSTFSSLSTTMRATNIFFDKAKIHKSK